MDTWGGFGGMSPLEIEAEQIREVEESDVRVTDGQPIPAPRGYWLKLAGAKRWMRMHGIKPIAERGRT